MPSTAELLRRAFARTPIPYVPRLGAGFPGLAAAGGDRRAQLQAYGSNGTLHAIVSNLANGTARVDWHLYAKRVDGRRRFGPAPDDRREITRHQALVVQQNPNPFMPWQEFCESFQQHVDLTGEGWWVVEFTKVGKIPVAMWPVRPDRMRPVPDPREYLAGYEYRSPDGEVIPLLREQVIMIRMPNPLDPYRGMGPVQALLTDIDSATYSAEWNRAFFRNSAQPGGIIELERSLNDTEWKKMVARWRESHQGVDNAHRVGILEYGKWKDVQFSMRDMQFTELRNVSREIIREAFSYPRFMLGEPEGSNRASAMAAEYVEARRLLVPRLERIKSALNSDFLPLFGGTADGLEFDYESPVPDDPETEIAILTQKITNVLALKAGGANVEQACELLGLPPIEFEDPEPVPAQLLPAGDPGADPAEDPAEDEPSNEDVAARAQKILAEGGLVSGILNGHARERLRR